MGLKQTKQKKRNFVVTYSVWLGIAELMNVTNKGTLLISCFINNHWFINVSKKYACVPKNTVRVMQICKKYKMHNIRASFIMHVCSNKSNPMVPWINNTNELITHNVDKTQGFDPLPRKTLEKTVHSYTCIRHIKYIVNQKYFSCLW